MGKVVSIRGADKEQEENLRERLLDAAEEAASLLRERAERETVERRQ